MGAEKTLRSQWTARFIIYWAKISNTCVTHLQTTFIQTLLLLTSILSRNQPNELWTSKIT